MAAPTPVSALVHSSTLVTAGVYIILRVFYLFKPLIQKLVLFIGLWTILIARFSACFEKDLKKIVAYSTMRQLGLMTVGLVRFNHLFSCYHLFTHALIKALLFIGGGYILIKNTHIQDFRSSKISFFRRPFLFLMLLLRGVVLSGIDFFSIFYSKELIILRFGGLSNRFFTCRFLLSLLFTAFYMFRLIKGCFVYLKKRRTYKSFSKRSLESSVIFLFLNRLFLGFNLFKNLLEFGLCRLGAESAVLALVYITAVALVALPIFKFYSRISRRRLTGLK
jgi:NADH:ubiquinone oxidoreductase subunit 5 (subunit L)/multisubunit Na+/H+ antiporter MnhA subunit